jgi:hypothetical protein
MTAAGEWLSRWILSGGAVGWIMVGMLIEIALLAGYRAFTGRGLPPKQLVATVVGGFGLLLALRFALAEPAQAGPIAFGLLLSLGAHVADLRMRWGRR